MTLFNKLFLKPKSYPCPNSNPEDNVNSGNLRYQCCCGSIILEFSEKIILTPYAMEIMDSHNHGSKICYKRFMYIKQVICKTKLCHFFFFLVKIVTFLSGFFLSCDFITEINNGSQGIHSGLCELSIKMKQIYTTSF